MIVKFPNDVKGKKQFKLAWGAWKGIWKSWLNADDLRTYRHPPPPTHTHPANMSPTLTLTPTPTPNATLCHVLYLLPRRASCGGCTKSSSDPCWINTPPEVRVVIGPPRWRQIRAWTGCQGDYDSTPCMDTKTWLLWMDTGGSYLL